MDYTTRLAAGGRWPADVELWHLHIPAAASERDWPWLDAGEQARAARYRQPADRIRFALTRSRLRQLLAARLDMSPAALRFVSNPWGRPELASGAGLAFNVSHGGDHALIALSAARQVGVDIERIDPALDWQALTGMVCTAAEMRAILAQPRWRHRQCFFQCWTAKEALLKACGLGIGAGLLGLELVHLGLEAREGEDAGGSLMLKGRSLHYHWLGDISGYGACIAYGQALSLEPGFSGG